jgi:hypothetical protein
MTCYNCGKKITHKRRDKFGEFKGEIAAKVFSFESGMCFACEADYAKWCVENEISPEEGGFDANAMTNMTKQ